VKLTLRFSSFAIVVVAALLAAIFYGIGPRPLLPREIFFAVLAGIIAVAILAGIFSYTLAKPIRELRDFADSMAGRDFSRRDVKASGEIEELADSLNRLSAQSEILESMRRDFVANVSHELKTPLTVIAGFADTLTDKDLPVESRVQFAESISRHAQRMRRIVDDLLDLSRVESGVWKPTLDRVDFVQLAEEIKDELTATPPRAITISVRADPGAEIVEADKTALRQILTNLIENSLRHTSSGSIAVASTLRGAAVDVSVADSGTGISPEHLPRIFERFYRIDTGRTRDHGGTGLGLAIVKHLSEAHGGSVRAESQLGRGSTIIVSLPRSRSG
jgi:signal transduction histidine kinase